MTDAEARALAAAKGLGEEEFRARFLREVRGRFTIRERANGDCEMLEGKTCSAYAARPRQCRTFPFWPEIFSTRQAWREAARACPGMNRGRVYTPEELEGLLEETLPEKPLRA